ncbi:methylmalonyl Co-A mutase-associated GTPase MeaB [bacterium]|nr:methylmalonyl Co-A mutase-associated GTPase MeaB [bacterium]
MPKYEDSHLLEAFRQGHRPALARMLTRVENQHPTTTTLLDQLYPSTGDAWRIGVTGPPGAGKSTLVNKLVTNYRKTDDQVGVIAFDPTSPFTGGALLGDRVRMETIGLDPGVFIRSMATRGHLGGLAVGVDEACDLFDAFGHSKILVETVGVGQSELEVANATDTTLVVIVPQSGDSIQAMKAGLMEIADIFVLNKSDRDGAEDAYRELVSIISMKEMEDGWRAPVLMTAANKGEGIAELSGMIASHRKHLVETGRLEQRRRKRTVAKTRRLIEDELSKKLWTPDRAAQTESGLAQGDSPYTMSQRLIADFYEELRREQEHSKTERS